MAVGAFLPWVELSGLFAASVNDFHSDAAREVRRGSDIRGLGCAGDRARGRRSEAVSEAGGAAIARNCDAPRLAISPYVLPVLIRSPSKGCTAKAPVPPMSRVRPPARCWHSWAWWRRDAHRSCGRWSSVRIALTGCSAGQTVAPTTSGSPTTSASVTTTTPSATTTATPRTSLFLLDCAHIVRSAGWTRAIADFGGWTHGVQLCGYVPDASALWVVFSPIQPPAPKDGTLLAVEHCAGSYASCSDSSSKRSLSNFTVYRPPDSADLLLPLTSWSQGNVGSVLWFLNSACTYVAFDFATDTWYQLVEHPKLEAQSINARMAPSKWRFSDTVGDHAAHDCRLTRRTR